MLTRQRRRRLNDDNASSTAAVLETGPFARISSHLKKLVAAFAGERAVRAMASTGRVWSRFAREYDSWTAFASLPQTISALECRSRVQSVTVDCCDKKIPDDCDLMVRWPPSVKHATIRLGRAVRDHHIRKLVRFLPATLSSLRLEVQMWGDQQTASECCGALGRIPRQNLESLTLRLRGLWFESVASEHAIELALAGLPRLRQLTLDFDHHQSPLNCVLTRLQAPRLEHVTTNSHYLTVTLAEDERNVPLPSIKTILAASSRHNVFDEFAKVYPACQELSGARFTLYEAVDLDSWAQARSHTLFARVPLWTDVQAKLTPQQWLALVRLLPGLVSEFCNVVYAQDNTAAIGAEIVDVLIKNRHAAGIKGTLQVTLNLGQVLSDAHGAQVIKTLLTTPMSVPGSKWKLFVGPLPNRWTSILAECQDATGPCLGHEVEL